MAPEPARWRVLRHVAEVSVAVLAIGYILGFLTWSFYSLSLGLGFLRLTPQQYLVAGALLGFFLLVLITPDWVLSKEVWKSFRRKAATPGNRSLRVLAELLVKAFAGFIALGALYMLASVIPLVDKTSVFSLANIFAFCVAPSILFLALLVSISWSRRPDKEEPKGKPPKLSPRGLGGLLGSAGIMLALGLVIFPTSFLPHMPQAFGGAQPREAYLEVDADDLSPATKSRLLPPELSNTTGTVRTVLLSVLYDGPDGILVRTAADAGATAPLYELSADIIRAKIWVS